ncbi:MAG: hypothetical protein ACREBD_13760 [Blastocatellia bacterium]
MTIARAALLGLMRRYLAAVMDPSVMLLEIHKLMYFMQESGEPLRLNYSKGPYGPYAENLRHVLNAIEGYYISGYGDAEDNPGKQIELKSEAAEQAEAFLQDHQKTQARFDRVANLIEGFESPYGMELLATVHWVARQEEATDVADTMAKVYGWNDRKRMFKEQHVQLAWELLHRKGWLSN